MRNKSNNTLQKNEDCCWSCHCCQCSWNWPQGSTTPPKEPSCSVRILFKIIRDLTSILDWKSFVKPLWKLRGSNLIAFPNLAHGARHGQMLVSVLLTNVDSTILNLSHMAVQTKVSPTKLPRTTTGAKRKKNSIFGPTENDDQLMIAVTGTVKNTSTLSELNKKKQ